MQDASTETGTFPFRINFNNGLTGEGIEGAEVCIVEPEMIEDPCSTTDSGGLITRTWENPQFGNLLSRFTLDGYVTTIYPGHFNEDVRDVWDALVTLNGSVEGQYFAFTEGQADAYSSTGGVTRTAGKGVVIYRVVDSDGNGVAGASVTLENAAGDSVGTVVYQSGTSIILDSSLTSTSGSGFVMIANVDPGDYTMRITHERAQCTALNSYFIDTANVVPVPVQADTLTSGLLLCE
jgi:hypothetical protein